MILAHNSISAPGHQIAAPAFELYPSRFAKQDFGIPSTRNQKKGESHMHLNSIIRQDVQKLLRDVQQFQRILEALEKDCEAWARECQENDLGRGIIQLKSLESDVSLMQTDCISICHVCQEDDAWVSLKTLRYAFAALNTLYNDLKKLRTKLKESYIHRAALKKLEIDWARFSKTVKEITRCLEYAENSLKSERGFNTSGAGRNVCFS